MKLSYEWIYLMINGTQYILNRLHADKFVADKNQKLNGADRGPKRR